MRQTPFLKNPNPAGSFHEAEQRIAILQNLDTEEVNPETPTVYLTHGHPTPRVIVLLHGYTNAPKQYSLLGQQFFELGYNVLVPRFPYHGLKDRLTTGLALLTPQLLIDHLTEAVDIALGLGDRVTVAGLSMGGVLAAWAGHFRADVSLAAAISPAFGFQALPAWITPLATRFFSIWPNQFMWWDSAKRNEPIPPLHAYPRLATRGLASILRIAQVLQDEAYRQPPQAGTVWVITNPTDESVDNQAAEGLVAAWRRAGARNVKTYVFEARHNLIHDLIDPDQPKQQVEIVYPILMDLLNQ